MLLWAFRDDPTVVKFMAQFVSKVRRSQTHVGIYGANVPSPLDLVLIV